MIKDDLKKLSNNYECNIELDGNKWLSAQDYVDACKFRNKKNKKYMEIYKTYTSQFKKIKKYHEEFEKEKNEYIKILVSKHFAKYPGLNKETVIKKLDEDLVLETGLENFRIKKKNEIKNIKDPKERVLANHGLNYIEFVQQENQKKEIKPIPEYNKIKKSAIILALFAKFSQNEDLKQLLLSLPISELSEDLKTVRKCIIKYNNFDISLISNFSSNLVTKIFIFNSIKN